ncbi:hypothetical protein BJV74DRAFT_427135 [Russula compacta]|nr:hypothetical protein BJV74DRAFT_427135 [Russula compacta]
MQPTSHDHSHLGLTTQTPRATFLDLMQHGTSSSLSFGALRKARRTLDRIHADLDVGEESDESYSTEEQKSDDSHDEERKQKDEFRVKEPEKDAAIAGRKSKNAPTEVTSKRPVSRRRMIVEVEKKVIRDPRFSQLSGEFDATMFRNHYKFLPEIREGELVTLRDNLKRARKLLVSSPRHLRPEREAEVERLALAVKRAESFVNRDKRERVEQQALSAVTKEERNKRQNGKTAFWLKKGGFFSISNNGHLDAIVQNS